MKTLFVLMFSSIFLCTILDGNFALAENIHTNAVVIHNPPDWLKRVRVEKVTNRIQTKLEWSTRRIQVYWHSNEKSFTSAHRFGPQAVAVTTKIKGIASIHMGPRVTDKNFDEVFGHEMVHVILIQKYKSSVPRWLEEGMANHLAQKKPVNYKLLAKQELPEDVKQLAHPFSGPKNQVATRYLASQALAEMLDKKCSLERLLQLSVERKMTPYFKTYCEIDDLNKSFRAWVKEKSSSES